MLYKRVCHKEGAFTLYVIKEIGCDVYDVVWSNGEDTKKLFSGSISEAERYVDEYKVDVYDEVLSDLEENISSYFTDMDLAKSLVHLCRIVNHCRGYLNGAFQFSSLKVSDYLDFEKDIFNHAEKRKKEIIKKENEENEACE